MRKDLVIAVDFDGTCVKHEYPLIGGDVGAVPVLKRIVNAGGRLILWTMRSGKELREAQQWFDDNKIELYGVQRNPTQNEWTKSPKAYAQVYIDDAALGCPLVHPGGWDEETRPWVDWNRVEEMLF